MPKKRRKAINTETTPDIPFQKVRVEWFASYDKDEDGITFGDRTMIPLPWVKKIQKL